MNSTIVIAVLVAIMVMGTVVAATASISSAEAKIECTNPGGGHPQGNCQGANENQNPSGKAPPGQN
jgi:hypothetical protein